MAMPRRFDCAFQVQAFRSTGWHVISRHRTEDAALRNRKKLSRCQPNDRHLWRVVSITQPDFIHDYE